MLTLTLATNPPIGFLGQLTLLVGRSHMVLLHFPIVLLIVAAGLELWTWLRDRGAARVCTIAGFCLRLGAAGAVVTAGTGWLLALEGGTSPEQELHRWIGMATAVVGLLAWYLRRRTGGGGLGKGGVVGAYRAVVFVGAVMVGVAGHLGGSLVHGDGYFSAPLKAMLHGGAAGGGGEPEGTGNDGDDGPPDAPEGGRARMPSVGGAGGNALFTRAWAVFESRCMECHGASKRKGGLRVDSRAALLKGGKHGPAIVVGDAAGSYLIHRVRGIGPDDRMPPCENEDEDNSLTDPQIEAIESWINAGAEWPSGRAAAEGKEEPHWAYVAPVKREPPPAGAWGRNAIDGFALAGMTRHKLTPSDEASKGQLLRRVTLDLTGLPPTLDELEAFERDQSPEAYERVVDRLLASPAFGERWARPWLDLARYGDSRGYEKDQTWVMWPYRDWVIDALNADMPFDRFSVEQIAGDLLPDSSVRQKTATAFMRLSMLNEEGGVDPEEARVTAVFDRADTTATVWLGATMGCARCHDHKFDPITTRDYYRFMAYFNSTAPETKQVGDGVTHLIAPSIEIPGVPGASVQVMKEEAKPRQTHVMHRGNFLDPGEPVEPGVPESLSAGVTPPARADRLGLAGWITDANNPLTARVAVNRIWSVYFGRGLVETEEDFGTRGGQPSHPELLDWLARTLVETGWSQKQIHRLIVTSATYRQSSAVSADKLAADPTNVWLSRGARFRLEAEAVRDQALAVGGLLSTKVGGPSVMPPQPGGVWGHAYSGEKWVESTGENRYRRAIYTFIKRATPYPSMAVFDAPARQVTCTRRTRSNTPLQALTTLNDPVFVEAATGLARRVIALRGDDAARIGWAFRVCLMRSASDAEVAVLARQLATARAKYAGSATEARRLIGAPESLAPAEAAELASWTVVANVILNLDEFLTKA